MTERREGAAAHTPARRTGAPRKQEDAGHFPEIRRVSCGGVRYALGHRLAQGAFCEVFEATDAWGNPLVAKRFGPAVGAAPWQRERAALARFRHPRVVFLHAAFVHGDDRYLIMERWGVSLARIRPQDAAHREALCRHVAAGLLEALHVIHRAGWVHGDINPGNVLLRLANAHRPAGIKLCDFALCRPDDASVPAPAVAAWNPPPEQWVPGGVRSSGRSMDIYHAALVLLEMLNGELPVFGEADILAGAPRQLAAAQGPLGQVLAEALSPEPRQRPEAGVLWRSIAGLSRPLKPLGAEPTFW